MSQRLSDEVVRLLGDEIATGQLPPGSTLNERTIGLRFKVSRTPAREVLLQLSAAGLVRFIPRRGAVVITRSPSEIVFMVEALVALEGEAASLAARRMEADERAKLLEQHQIAQDAVERMSIEDYSDANSAFHGLIYVGCRNPFLTSEIKALRQRLAPYLRQSFIRQGRIRSSYAEHGAIVAAIGNFDEAGAAQAIRQHILNGGNLYADMLSKLAGQ
jgi:DNA-binding GntR family transcriptional regulator